MVPTHLNGREKNKGGFSLIEILVVIFFFSVLSVLVVFKYRDFDGSVILNNQSLDVALAIREAQVKALSSLEKPGAGSVLDPQNFRFAYGVFFDRNQSRTAYVSYVDNNGDVSNGWFDDGNFTCASGGECVQKHVLSAGQSVADICIDNVCGQTDVSISFQRPKPDAIILSNISGTDASLVEIKLLSTQGGTRSVFVTKAGQIYLK